MAGHGDADPHPPRQPLERAGAGAHAGDQRARRDRRVLRRQRRLLAATSKERTRSTCRRPRSTTDRARSARESALCGADTLGDLAIDLAVHAGRPDASSPARPARRESSVRCRNWSTTCGKELDFPHGVFLMTGTGIVPPDDFSLAARRSRPHHDRRTDARKRGRTADEPRTHPRRRRRSSRRRGRRRSGPEGRLPITPEMLLAEPSGNLFGMTQDAGMGWNPAEVERDAGPHHQHAGRPARARRTAESRSDFTPDTGRSACWSSGGRRDAARRGRRAVRRVLSAIRATAARRARSGCSTACRIATTRRSPCGG